MANTTRYYYSLPTQPPQQPRSTSGTRRPPLTPSTVSSPCLTTQSTIASRRDSGSGSPTKASALLAKVASHPATPRVETPLGSPTSSPEERMHSSPMYSPDRPAVWRSESARYVHQYRKQDGYISFPDFEKFCQSQNPYQQQPREHSARSPTINAIAELLSTVHKRHRHSFVKDMSIGAHAPAPHELRTKPRIGNREIRSSRTGRHGNLRSHRRKGTSSSLELAMRRTLLGEKQIEEKFEKRLHQAAPFSLVPLEEEFRSTAKSRRVKGSIEQCRRLVCGRIEVARREARLVVRTESSES